MFSSVVNLNQLKSTLEEEIFVCSAENLHEMVEKFLPQELDYICKNYANHLSRIRGFCMSIFIVLSGITPF